MYPFPSLFTDRNQMHQDDRSYLYHCNLEHTLPDQQSRNNAPCRAKSQVGLCAITSATLLFSTVLAVDPNPARRQLAEKHGARPCAPEDIKRAVAEATEGRGADAVLEVVGHQSALELAIDLVRPYGAVSSVGVHQGERAMLGEVLYGKKWVSFCVCDRCGQYER